MCIRDRATTARPGNIKANAGGITKTISPGLYAVGCLILGLDYASSTQTIYVPDLRGEFLRGWSDGSGVDAGRVIGSTQAGTEFPSLYVYSASSSSGLLVSHPISSNRGYPNDNIAKNTDSRISGTSSNYMSVPLSPAGVSSLVHFTARPRNVSMLAQIHL